MKNIILVVATFFAVIFLFGNSAVNAQFASDGRRSIALDTCKPLAEVEEMYGVKMPFASYEDETSLSGMIQTPMTARQIGWDIIGVWNERVLKSGAVEMCFTILDPDATIYIMNGSNPKKTYYGYLNNCRHPTKKVFKNRILVPPPVTVTVTKTAPIPDCLSKGLETDPTDPYTCIAVRKVSVEATLDCSKWGLQPHPTIANTCYQPTVVCPTCPTITSDAIKDGLFSTDTILSGVVGAAEGALLSSGGLKDRSIGAGISGGISLAINLGVKASSKNARSDVGRIFHIKTPDGKTTDVRLMKGESKTVDGIVFAATNEGWNVTAPGCGTNTAGLNTAFIFTPVGLPNPFSKDKTIAGVKTLPTGNPTPVRNPSAGNPYRSEFAQSGNQTPAIKVTTENGVTKVAGLY